MDSLDTLVALITSGVSDIKAAYAAESVDFPTLDNPYVPASVDGKVLDAVNVVVTAAFHLIAMIRTPMDSVLDATFGMHQTAAIGTVTAQNIPEILREAGPMGLHVCDIGEKAGTSSTKIGRLLRLLASRHIFREISPNVFAHNRLSSVLDTGKDIVDIAENIAQKHANTSGFPALVCHVSDEMFKAAAHLQTFFEDKDAVFSDEPSTTPLSHAFEMSGTIWDFYSRPENRLRQARFNIAMEGSTKLYPPSLILDSYDWSSLKNGETIVDVGGGIGSSTMILAKKFPELKFIVQDLPDTIDQGRTYWQNENPEAITGGQVQLQESNFLEAQSVTDAAVFLLRAIAHDWPTSYVKRILRHLRASSQPTTRVVMVGLIIPNVFNIADSKPSFDIPGANLPPLPLPLIRGMNTLDFNWDIQMQLAVNGQERTVYDYIDAVDGTGWKICEIIRGPMSSVVLVPI